MPSRPSPIALAPLILLAAGSVLGATAAARAQPVLDPTAVASSEVAAAGAPAEAGEEVSAEPVDEDAGRPFPRTRWRWTRADIGNYVLMGIGGATAASMIGIGAAGVTTPTRGGILFDEDARDAIRLSEEGARLIARDVSDAFLSLLTSAPILMDALILGAWQHDDPDMALELILIHAEVIFVTLGLQTVANIAASRERPYGRTCGGPTDDDLPEASFFCNSPDRYYSFFSGHTSQSFASAAVVCSAHMNMPLLGGGAADVVPCVTGFAFAAATGLLRMMGDMHYATDVITGAVMGTAVGFLIPWALHYAHERPASGRGSSSEGGSEVMMSVVPNGAGAALIGIW